MKVANFIHSWLDATQSPRWPERKSKTELGKKREREREREERESKREKGQAVRKSGREGDRKTERNK